MASEQEQDAAELRQLLATATRPNVRALLTQELDRVTAASAAAQPAAASHPVPLAAVTNAPLLVTGPPSASPRPVTYTQPSYGFSSEGEFVEVLLLDLPGVGALPRELVTAAFTPTSFDLRVHGLGGRNYRLTVPHLEKEIVPDRSKLVVGKSRVTLKLAKRHSWDFWSALAAKKPPAGAAKQAEGGAGLGEDGMGGLMDVMKDVRAIVY